MALQLGITEDRYKVAATLTECLLFEFSISTKVLEVYYGLDTLTKSGTVIQDIKNNKKVIDRIHPDDFELFNGFCDELYSARDDIRAELRIQDTNFIYQWCNITCKLLTDDNNKPIKIIGRLTNIDIQRRETERLKEKTERDSLTKLYNKSAAELKINNILRNSDTSKGGAFMLVDFDDFKEINDQLGHLFGDSILRNVSAQIQRSFRNTDVVARVGSDVFVVFANGINTKDLIVKKAEAIHNIFNEAYHNDGIDKRTSCSIGIAIAPDDGKSYKTLFKKADSALYSAKSNGKNRYQIYDESQIDEKLIAQNEYHTNYKVEEYPEVREMKHMNSFFTNIVDILFSTKDLDGAINTILGLVGKKYDIDNIHIFEMDEDNTVLNPSYEWNNDGVDARFGILKDIPMKIVDELLYMFDEEGIFYSSNIEELKGEHNSIYYTIKKTGVRSVVATAITEMGDFRGLIGFDEIDTNRMWTKEEVEALSVISRLIGAYMNQMRLRSNLMEEKLLLKEISNNQKIYCYILEPNTFKLLYMDENTKALYPNANVGDICYKKFLNLNKPCEHCPLNKLDKESNSMDGSVVDFYNTLQNLRLKITATPIEWGGHLSHLICASEVTDFLKIIKEKDDFTGLPTLAKFEDDLDNLLLSAHRQYAVVTLDIDKFKNINGSLGYLVGNDVLMTFVRTISGQLEEDEIFCRSTADKFVLLLQYEDYESIYNRLNLLLETTTKILNNRFESLHIVITAGLYITDINDYSSTAAIDKADIARKSIKGAHKSIFANYDSKIHNKVMKEKEIESHMHSALANEEFVIYYQPKVDLKTRKTVGAEALVRWQPIDGTLIPPNDFIPIFEKNGFIAQMDFYVYNKVLSDMRKWLNEGKECLRVSVNISRIHLEDKNFVNKMIELTKTYNIPPQMLELEITESLFIKEANTLIDMIDQLKAVGFVLSIDDFGSGFSSLNLLRHLHLDTLKLDKEFFDQDHISEKEHIVLTNIIRMIKELDMEVLSEGVETKEQVEYLTRIGCDMAQGYYFARPMPIGEFEKRVWKDYAVI